MVDRPSRTGAWPKAAVGSPCRCPRNVAIGIKSKTQVELNAGLAEKWAKESDKRNRYFKDFGISIVTFSDPELDDIDECFRSIVSAVEERPKHKVTLAGAETALQEAFGAIEV